MQKVKTDLTKGNILKGLLLFALPILVSNIFQQLYNTVDTLIVGNTLGEVSLAAMGSCSTVYDILLTFSVGVGVGMSVVVARSFGSGDMDKLKKAVAGAIVIGIFMAIVLTIAAHIVLKPLLGVLDTPAEILEEGYSYISVIVSFLVVTFAYNLCSGLLRAIGNSFMPLVFLVISSAVNIMLDLLFITKLHMGVAGAAWATVLAQGLSAALCVVYIFTKCRVLLPARRHFEHDGKLYHELVSQGFSIGCMNALIFVGTLILQRSINQLGTLVIAGHTTARKITSFGVMPCGTVSTAVSTFVSQNRGANNRDRIRKGIRVGYMIVCGYAVIATVVMALFAPSLAKLVSGSTEPVIVDNVSGYLRLAAPFYSVLGVLFISRHCLQGIGQKIIPIISSCIELVGKILFASLLVPHLGYRAVIACEPVVCTIMIMVLVPSLLRHPYLREKE